MTRDTHTHTHCHNYKAQLNITKHWTNMAFNFGPYSVWGPFFHSVCQQMIFYNTDSTLIWWVDGRRSAARNLILGENIKRFTSNYHTDLLKWVMAGCMTFAFTLLLPPPIILTEKRFFYAIYNRTFIHLNIQSHHSSVCLLLLSFFVVVVSTLKVYGELPLYTRPSFMTPFMFNGLYIVLLILRWLAVEVVMVVSINTVSHFTPTTIHWLAPA